MKRFKIHPKNSWSNHEQRVLRVFVRALESLRKQHSLDEREDSLNRRLLQCIRTANCELNKHGAGVGHPIFYEANNQPDADDTVRAKREGKRPDFQWGLTDTSEPDPLRQDRFYVVECKRLGDPVHPVRTDRIFNENYVKKGVFRFVTKEHGYGKSAPSGAMVGYIRSMASADILDEVNGNATRASLHKINLNKDGWVAKGVSRLEQTIDRPNVPPTPFSLRHLWVDLRHK